MPFYTRIDPDQWGQALVILVRQLDAARQERDEANRAISDRKQWNLTSADEVRAYNRFMSAGHAIADLENLTKLLAAAIEEQRGHIEWDSTHHQDSGARSFPDLVRNGEVFYVGYRILPRWEPAIKGPAPKACDLCTHPFDTTQDDAYLWRGVRHGEDETPTDWYLCKQCDQQAQRIEGEDIPDRSAAKYDQAQRMACHSCGAILSIEGHRKGCEIYDDPNDHFYDDEGRA